jgi:hypothetical protein
LFRSPVYFKVVDVIDLTDVVDASEETENFLGALVVSPLEIAALN